MAVLAIRTLGATFDQASVLVLAGGGFVGDLGIPAGVTSRLGIDPPRYGPAFIAPLQRERLALSKACGSDQRPGTIRGAPRFGPRG